MRGSDEEENEYEGTRRGAASNKRKYGVSAPSAVLPAHRSYCHHTNCLHAAVWTLACKSDDEATSRLKKAKSADDDDEEEDEEESASETEKPAKGKAKAKPKAKAEASESESGSGACCSLRHDPVVCLLQRLDCCWGQVMMTRALMRNRSPKTSLKTKAQATPVMRKSKRMLRP